MKKRRCAICPRALGKLKGRRGFIDHGAPPKAVPEEEGSRLSNVNQDGIG